MTVYVAVGPHCWGRGKTMAEAKRKAKRFAPSWMRTLVFRMFKITGDDQPYVNGMGYVCCDADGAKIEEVSKRAS